MHVVAGPIAEFIHRSRGGAGAINVGRLLREYGGALVRPMHREGPVRYLGDARREVPMINERLARRALVLITLLGLVLGVATILIGRRELAHGC